MNDEDRLLRRIAPYRKAAAALAVPPLVAAWIASDGGITATEWIAVALSGLSTGGAVFAAPNAALPDAHRVPSPPDAT